MSIVSVFSIITLFIFFYINTPFAACAKVRSSGNNTVEPSKANYDLGLTKYNEHDLDGAIDAFLQAIYFNRSSYNPDAYYWLGVCYQEKNLDAKAIEALKKCLEQAIKPMPNAHLHLAQLYLRNKRLQEAESEANRAWLDLKGHCPEAQNILGLIEEERNNFPRAQDHFVDALGEPPWRYTEAWMNYIEVLMKQKDWGGAITQAHKMLNHPKKLVGIDHERIYLDIGICLLAKGDHQGAMDNWHEVLNYNPHNAMAHLQLALLLDSERHMSSAIKEYKEYIRLSPGSPDIGKIKTQVLLLEQTLRATPEAPVMTPYISPNAPPLSKEESERPDNLNSPPENISSAKAKKKDALEPHGGKESGF